MLNALFGNSAEIDPAKLRKEFEPYLIDGEEILYSFKLFRDLTVFTNYRLVLVDKQGLTGKKREYTSIPYKSIDLVSMETAGHFDGDSEIVLWVKSKGPIKLEFKKDGRIDEVFKLVSHYSLAA